MDEAIKILCAKHVHQCLWLPQTSSHDRLRVSYSTTANWDDDRLPVVLFCGPMFGSRWNSVFVGNLAKETGVRVICCDRPGMGGSTPVPLGQRVPVWLETVPALLEKLQVKHVSLLSHSCGTIYALNTMYHLPEILEPHAPYVALIAPWVSNEHSHVTLMNVVSKFSPGVIDHWDQLNRFIISRIMPATSWSGGFISSVGNLFQAEPGAADSGETTPAEEYGVSEDIAKHIDPLKMKYFMAESTVAANEETKMCLRKADYDWGICDDYEEYVRSLVKQREGLQSGDGSSTAKSKLKIRIYFAESDMLTGKGGQQYFEQCWKQDNIAAVIELQSKVLPGTNHETALVDVKKGALKTVLHDVKEQKERQIE